MNVKEIVEHCKRVACCPLGLALQSQYSFQNPTPNKWCAAKRLNIPFSVAEKIADTWDNGRHEEAAQIALDNAVL